jgi:rRNA maturation RNase YbeY
MITVLISGDSKYPVDREVIRSVVRQVLTAGGIIEGEVSVHVAGKRKMLELAGKFGGDVAAHEILTFAYADPAQEQPFISPEGQMILGDIIISYPDVLALATQKNRLVDEIVADLISHGCQHLLGHHHE